MAGRWLAEGQAGQEEEGNHRGAGDADLAVSGPTFSVIAEAGISDLFTRRGALYVYETDRASPARPPGGTRAPATAFARNASMRARSPNWEPMIAPIFRHGYLVEDPGHVADPWPVVLRLAAHFQRIGGEINAAACGIRGGAPRRP